MPIIPLIIVIAIMLCGLAAMYVGLKIWRNKRVDYIHEYHRENVKESDIAEYAKGAGKAVVLIGSGIFVSSLLFILTEAVWVWIIFALCFIAGLIYLYKTTKKYN